MPASPSRAPSLIAGRYRLEGPLGRGGMAEVRAGTDLRLQRPVAVKLLLPEMAVREDIRRRFTAEARAAASFNDPHAVAVYDTGEHDGAPYIVMERLPGETLADCIAAGPQDPEWIRRGAREVLGALSAAHAAGLVHRDVKPGNILLTADGHAKITDFGIAKSLEATDGAGDLTGTGQLLGTPAYLAPERLDGAPATAKSDLYSLGVVLYEALTGHCPFSGETPIATATAIVAGKYAPLGQARPGLDPALVATVDRAMAADPDRPFGTASAMAAALSPAPGAGAGAGAGAPTVLDAAVRSDRTAVLDLRPLPAGPLPAGPLPAGPLPVPPAAIPAARRRYRLPLALALGAVFALVLAAGTAGRDKTPTNQPAGAQTASTLPATTAVSGPLTVITAPDDPVRTTPTTAAKAPKGKAKGRE